MRSQQLGSGGWQRQQRGVRRPGGSGDVVLVGLRVRASCRLQREPHRRHQLKLKAPSSAPAPPAQAGRHDGGAARV